MKDKYANAWIGVVPQICENEQTIQCIPSPTSKQGTLIQNKYASNQTTLIMWRVVT